MGHQAVCRAGAIRHPVPPGPVLRRGLARLAGGLLMLLLGVMPVLAQDVTGRWWTPERDGQIEIFRQPDGTVAGRIVALLPADAARLDVRNPDSARRAQPVLGLVMMWGFAEGSDRRWTGGHIYDPKEGATYNGKLWLESADRLRLRGYVGIALFGRSELIERVQDPAPTDPVLVSMAGP